MKILVPGHRYELQNFEDPEKFQTLQFIHKDLKDDHPLAKKELVTVSDGTTNEEVLLMMIDRMKYVNDVLPSRETSLAITKLEEAVMWLGKRTVERQARGVEGTREP